MIAIFSLILAVIVFGFSSYQWWKAQKVKRIDLVLSMMDKFIENDDVIHAMEFIDYDENWYSKNFHSPQSIEQEKMDKLFTVMNNLSMLANTKLIKNEIEPFEYNLIRFLQNEQVKHYLWNLHRFSIKNGVKSSYNELVQYGISNKIYSLDEFESDIAFIRKFQV